MDFPARLGELTKRPAVAAVLVLLACLVVYVPTVATTHVNTDAAANSLAAWRLADTGKPWMDGLDLREPGKVPHYGVGRDGHMVTTRTPGQIWAAAPFYLGTSSSQAEWWYTRGGIAAASLTALAVALLFLALQEALGSTMRAAMVSGVFAFASPVWSVSANALWTHPVTLLGLAGAAWASACGRWLQAGVWLGVAMTGRVHIALIAAALGLGLAWTHKRPAIALCIGVPSLAALCGITAWNYFVFGAWDPRGPYVGHEVENIVPTVSQGGGGYLANLAGFLVSPDRGILVWTPVLALMAPAVFRALPSAPPWMRWLAAGGLMYSAAQLGLNVFHGGDAIYGYRLGLELLICLAPLYAFATRTAGRWTRTIVPPLVGIQAGAFFVGSVIDTVSLPEADVWRDNALWRAVIDYPTSLGLVFLLVAVGVWVAVHRAISVAAEPSDETVDQRTVYTSST